MNYKTMNRKELVKAYMIALEGLSRTISEPGRNMLRNEMNDILTQLMKRETFFESIKRKIKDRYVI